MIEAVTVYRTRGKQFERFDQAVAHREQLINDFMEKCPGFFMLQLKDRTAFIESILSRRQELRDLLNYEDKPERDDD